MSMGLVDAVPDKLKNVFASKPKPTSRRFVVGRCLCLVAIDANISISNSYRALLSSASLSWGDGASGAVVVVVVAAVGGGDVVIERCRC